MTDDAIQELVGRRDVTVEQVCVAIRALMTQRDEARRLGLEALDFVGDVSDPEAADRLAEIHTALAVAQ